MLRKIFAAACFALCVASSPAHAVDTATAVATCGGLSLTAGYAYGITQDLTGELCTNASGGGGGLSVQDGATFTAGTSNFTPTGGEYNSSPTTLTSGKQGTLALNQYRSAFVDVMTTNNNLYAAITAAVPCLNATAATTNSYSNAQTNPVNCDLHGNVYTQSTLLAGSAAIGTVNPTTAANWGIVATGAAPPANAIYLGTNQSGATGGHVGGLISCDNHVFKHITSATDTLAVQGVASQTIYICGWRSRAAGVATWYLENTASTNANCSSTLTQITGVATEAANTGETTRVAFWDGLKNTSGNGLCINSTGTGGVDVDIWYTQF